MWKNLPKWSEPPSIGRWTFNRSQAMQATLVAASLITIGSAGLNWLGRGWIVDLDPFTPMAFAIGLAVLPLAFAPKSWSVELRAAIFQTLVLTAIIVYTLWRYSLGNPLMHTTYMLIPILMALLFSRIRGTLIVAGVGIVWIVTSYSMGWGSSNIDDSIATSMLIAFSVLVAVTLEYERQKNRKLTNHWRDEHAGLETILASLDEAVFSVNAKGETVFSNGAGDNWRDHVAGAPVDANRFWQNMSENHRNNFENGLYEALAGKPHSYSFAAPMLGDERNWWAKFIPNQDGENAIIMIRDQTEHMSHAQKVMAASNATRIQTLNLVTHQLNTPLMPILLTSHVLRSELLESGNESSIEKVDMIERNARRAIDMVTQIIEQSKGHSILPEAVSEELE